MENIEQDIEDILLEVPRGFKVMDRKLYIYPVTLGKSILIGRILPTLEINSKNMATSPYLEALRVSETKKEEVCRFIAYHTAKNKEEVFDTDYINDVTEHLKAFADNEDLAKVLLVILGSTSISQIYKHFGIDKEKEKMEKVMRVKEKDSHNITLFGTSVYGTLIDTACERYGWTLDYVVWGISYMNLQLMLEDSVKTVYLSDKEMKMVHIPKRGEKVIDAGNKDSWKDILSMDWG